MTNKHQLRIVVWILIILSMLSLVYALPGTNVISQVRQFFVDNYYEPVITNVTSIPSMNPIDGNITYVYINFTATDNDGVEDLNDSSALVVFNFSSTQRLGNCTPNDINTTTTIYVCNVSMWYYDEPGTWDINVSVKDNMSYVAYNDTTSFVYNTLSAIRIYLTELTFDTVYIRQPTGASNDPIIINNTGNVDFTNISLRAYDLVGVNDSSYVIYADQFAASITDSYSDVLQNNTFINITDAYLNHGPTATEEIYIWVNVSYDVIAQTYNSSVHDEWMILVE